MGSMSGNEDSMTFSASTFTAYSLAAVLEALCVELKLDEKGLTLTELTIRKTSSDAISVTITLAPPRESTFPVSFPCRCLATGR